MSRFTKGLFAVAGMSLCVSGAALANDLTVVSWGGAYTMSQVEAYHKPWMAKTGKTIVSEDYSGGIAEIKAQVESGNVTWDIVDVNYPMPYVLVMRGLLRRLITQLCRQRLTAHQQLRTFYRGLYKIVLWQTFSGHQFMFMMQVKHVIGMRQRPWLIFLTSRLFQASVA